MNRLRRSARRWRWISGLTFVAAVILLVVGLGIGIFSERAYREQKVQEASVQSRILAASVTGALAFDDAKTVQEYVQALAANPDVEAAAVYNDAGLAVARFTRPGQSPAPLRPPAQSGARDPAHLTTLTPVSERGAVLGDVYLRTTLDRPTRRLMRYGGRALLLIMAGLVLGVLFVAQRALRRANLDLEERASDLAESNRRLQEQMAEREKAEEALRQSQKMEAIGQLTGGVAHDFNNLLMVASSGLELLERTEDPDRRARLKDGVRRALDRGASLTRQLLAFSRRSALKPQVIDLTTQVEALQLFLERSLREDIHVVLDLERGLWTVEIDPGEFEVALLNMAVNARDAMPDGGVLTITGRNRPGGPDGADQVELVVADTGSGIPPENLAHVFEPFFTTKQVGQGTGLGLSQIYGFARASGGDIRIESVVNEGTRIHISLPRSLKQPAAAAAHDLAGTGGDGRILLVEDDDGVALNVAAMLEELGYRVERVGNAAAALEALKADAAYDLVFSDMVMPGAMSGQDLAVAIARAWPDLPILLTTGFSAAAAAAQADGLRVLSKPYDLAALGREIGAAMRRP